jgi:uncharacterized protein
MPSPLFDRLLADIKTAMKSGDKDNLAALRMLHAQIKDATVNAGREVTDADVAALIAKAIKQRQDSAAQFEQGGRLELAGKEKKEIELYRKYQPMQLTEAEIKDLVASAIAETAAASKKDMGKVMAALMPHVKGKADGKLVSQIVQAALPG